MIVLITGTSQGIGKAIAEKFLKENHTVVGLDILDSTIIDPNYTHYICDISNDFSIKMLPSSVLHESYDIVINNAGIQGTSRDIDVNLKGTINITERFAFNPHIKSVLMIGSASAHTGAEFPEYSASKGGVLAYTKNVAIRLAQHGATCNSLDFGGVTTELNKPVMEDKVLWKQIMDVTPLKRWMSPEECADWAYFITVIQSSMSGQNLLIDMGEANLNATFVWPGVQ